MGSCTKPITAWQTTDGTIKFVERGDIKREIELACGRCMGCRLERARQWAVRCMHESQMHQNNCFITLTYDKSPRTLDYTDFQKFMRRLRKSEQHTDDFGNRWRLPIRFFMCGEYGEKYDRPHFHSCMFNYSPIDQRLHSSANGTKLYTSKTLEILWGHGYVTVGELNYQTAQYVAAYCTKKVTGDKAIDHYTKVDKDTGEVYQLEPEFSRQSLKPGIGEPWLRRYVNDVYNYDHVVMNGRSGKTPKYYDTLLKKWDPERAEKLELPRYKKAMEYGGINTTDRLEAKDKITRARLELSKRNKI